MCAVLAYAACLEKNRRKWVYFSRRVSLHTPSTQTHTHTHTDTDTDTDIDMAVHLPSKRFLNQAYDMKISLPMYILKGYNYSTENS